MPSSRTPLLASPRPSGESARSDELAEEEDDALQRATGQDRLSAARWARRLREVLPFLWTLLATASLILLAVWVQHRQQTSPRRHVDGKRNLVFMVSDGMGPASLSLTRSFRQLVEDLAIDDTLALDRHFWGTSRTRSSDRLVTDSAAGATAFACGKKSYNGAIATLPDSSPCGTVLEAAKRAGYLTGMVVTTDVTDATPACFASHVKQRVQNDEIALQEVGEGPLGHVVDLLMGGGRCHFLPNSSLGSCRQDDVDVVAIAQKHGWAVLDDRSGFDTISRVENVTLPILGLFASTDLPFELDRRNMAAVYPSLSEMTGAALSILEEATKGTDRGFFLMVEGSRIDHAGHYNDPAAQVHEVLEYDKTFQTVLDFLGHGDHEGLVVSTSDHETGGLSTSFQEPGHLPVYDWFPSQLANVNASTERLALLLWDHLASTGRQAAPSPQSLKDWINTHLVIGLLGITDARDDELDALVSNPAGATTTFADMVSLRAHIGWSTHGHSAVDVNIYSNGGPGLEKLRGNVENTDIGIFLREYLDVDVDGITEELNDPPRSKGRYTFMA